MGPLNGIKVVELAGIGAGPFCAQMMADMGADIIRIDRKSTNGPKKNYKFDVMNRNRRSVALDLKNPVGVNTVLRLIDKADALIEGYRPGVAERLGIGPEVCLGRNAKLVYGRITGWGQDGPLSHAAGHDINFIALSGALHAIGYRNQPPVPSLNMLGDFGGGGMMLAFGIACGIIEAQKSGRGQVIDASMLEGTALMMNLFFGLKAAGEWTDERENNLLDGGAHFYRCYETSDRKWVAIASIEPQFYDLLLKLTGISDTEFLDNMNKHKWPQLIEKLSDVFRAKSRDEWCDILEGSDVCFAPVLSLEEVPDHPHNKARGSFIEVDGIVQAAPAPKFSRTKPDFPKSPPLIGEHNETALKDWGFSKIEVDELKRSCAI
jgi:alpha-methylacyl-CoA racemase